MTEITVNGLIEALAATIAGSSTLRQHCLSAYGKDLSVQIGENPENPAGEAQAPCVILNAAADPHNLGIAQSRDYGLVVTWLIVSDSKTAAEATDEAAAVVRYGNVAASDAFGMLLVQVIRDALAAFNLQYDTMDYSLDTILQWPLAEGTIFLKASAQNTF
jgi:hypothetical protein